MKLQTELVGISAVFGIFGFANGLVGVFIPLLILNSGAPLWQVPAFYVGYATVKLFINFPIAKYVVQRHGAHFALGIGVAASIGEMLSLRAFVEWRSLLWLLVAAVFLAFINASLWISQHLHISAIAHNATTSSSVATISSITQVLSFLAPLVGGVIASVFGVSVLLVVAICVLFVAFIPQQMVKTLENARVERQNEEPIRYTLAGVPKRDLSANFCWNVESATGDLVWPIFLALTFASFSSIGLVSAASGACALIVMWIAGHRGDRGADRRVLTEAASVSTVINATRIFAAGTIVPTLITVIYRSSLSYGQVAWAASYYKRANAAGPQWVMAMEIACDLAYLSMWSMLLALASLTTSDVMFTVAFCVAGVCAWGCLLLTRPRPL